jgi:predicted transcriptional regulator
MEITTRHRRAAQAIWTAGGRLQDAAKAVRLSPATLRRWLAEPAFRALLAEEAAEPFLQAASAVLQWAPAAVARLIEDLRGESPADARQAAREILRLAADTQQVLAKGSSQATRSPADALDADDPLGRRVADLTDDQVRRIFAILDGSPKP